MLRLRLFGGLAVERDGAAAVEIAGQTKSLALLALLAVSGERGLSRDSLAAYLWPESDAERARGALSQTLYALRKQLAAAELFEGTRTLRLNGALIGNDVRELEDALARGDAEAAVSLYHGPFLDGFFPSGSAELERWIDGHRADFARRIAAAMESLAAAASERGDYAASVDWWRRRGALDPGNSRVAAALVSALAQAGDRGGALRAARTHDEFLSAEFEAKPDPSLSALADEIRREPGVSSSRTPDAARGQSEAPAKRADGLATVPRLTRRMTSRRLVAIAVLSGAVVGAGMIATSTAHEPKIAGAVLSNRRIAVAAFDNQTGDSSLDLVARMATEWLVHGLVQTQLLEVVSPGVLESSLPALDDAGRPGATAGLVVHGSFARLADSLVMQAQILDVSTGRVIRAVGPVTGPLHEPLVAIERLRQRLTGALATRIDRRLSSWTDDASQPTSFEAYRAFDEGLNQFFAGDDSAMARAGRLLVHAASLDQGFSLPLLWATYAFANAGDAVRLDSVVRVLVARRERLPRFDRALLDARTADIRGDEMAAYEALRRVVAIAPNSEWLYKLADAAMVLTRWSEADSLLRAVDPNVGWMREWPNYWAVFANAQYQLGHHDDELAAVVRRRSRFPNQDPMLREHGRALAALGRDTELLTLLDGHLRPTPRYIDTEGLFRMLNAARVHGHLRLARAVADRALRLETATRDTDKAVDSNTRFDLLVLEASEQWDDAVVSARKRIRADSIAGRHDALPYTVILQAALRRGALQDTAGLEAKALAEAAVKMESVEGDAWSVESDLAVRAELAALHRDARTTATLLKEASDRSLFNYYWFSERPAFDPVRGDPLVAKWLHNPAADRR
jgi:DNA-binding SARP family transcriptional activator/TolB-like protein